MGLMIFSLSF